MESEWDEDRESSCKPLPVGTRIPDAVVGGVGVFALDASHDTTHLVVVTQKG
ncbi:hypothetical protein [Saccharopolyspora sp. ASAGF58]|uniref:hypothetical protein n=1 Tax=Saccharopolyspora sp. ASAGF58 TaxID=2719023 RepID=UPI0014487794|nr:hypothetical protein [Saccharopolyspora sp. ASAGF58]